MKDEGTPTDATLPVDPTTMGAATAPARSIGRFVVIDVLGQGAMGLVLAAYDPDLDRKIAVKLLRPDAYDATSREGRERMLREARALAKLSHPNVIAIHEVGTVDDRVFLAMEFAPGGTLRSWLTAEKRPWREVLAKLVQAGHGLAAAHDAGLVHRDFKPTNVLLAKGGEARVADFGLVGGHASVGPPSQSGDEPIELTHTGALLGTPAYMAPEQLDPDSGEAVGPAADQFAFCVSAWECLHGTRPFEGTTIDTIGDNVRHHRVVDPPAGTEVPAWLRGVLKRGMAPRPGDRWPSMNALLAELARDPMATRARRLRAALIGAAAIAAVATVALVASRSSSTGPQCEDMERALVGVWDDTRDAAIRDAFAKTGAPNATDTAARVAKTISDYTTAWVRARRTSCEATHVHGDQSAELLDRKVACLDRRLVDVNALVDLLVDAKTPEVVDRSLGAALRLPTLADCADPDALQPVLELPSQPATRAEIESIRVQLAAAKALADTGQYKLARARVDDLVVRATTIAYAPLVADVLYRRGHMERLDGDAAAALTTFDAALFAASDARDDRLFVELISDKIFVLGDQLQRPREALALRPIAEAALRRAGGDRVTTGNLMANVGRVLISDNKHAEALEILEKALAIKEATSGRDSFDVARTLTSVGNALYEHERLAEALEKHERAAAIWRATFGPNHPDVIMIEANIANIYFSKGDLVTALARYELAATKIAALLGADHPLVADLELNIGNTLSKLERFDEAIARYHKAIEIKAKTQGKVHADIARMLYSLGEIHYAVDRYDDARDSHQKSIAMYEAVGMGDSDDVTFPLTQLAEVQLNTGRTNEALRLAERSLAIREKSEIDRSELEYGRMVVGRILLELDRDRPKAMKLMTDARAFFVAQGNAGARRVVLVDKILAAYKR